MADRKLDLQTKTDPGTEDLSMKTKNVLDSQFRGSLASTEANKELSSEQVSSYLTAESYGHKLKYSLHFLSSHCCNKEPFR